MLFVGLESWQLWDEHEEEALMHCQRLLRILAINR
jgi:hypothetical protein